MTTSVETFEFRSEARQLLRLMIHSVYSSKDVFLRELVSNASDALDKVRLAAFQDKDLDVDTDDLHILVETDLEARTVTVRDNGIGMDRDEVVELIGTIARSGTAELLARLEKSADDTGELIGQFGVGFYASFMVADRVTMLTRRAGAADGVRWESTGEGSYTIEAVADLPQGTTVTLHLKPVDTEDRLLDYTEPATVRDIVKRYSDFITWPIRMAGEDGELETVNSMKALWARPRGEVTDAEYHEFYKHVSHDWAEPLETIRLAAEGAFEYQALLFLPSQPPLDLFMRDARRGVQLYVRRVFVMDDCAALVPEYLRFVRGVVDAQDLSLNVSREILQQDRQIELIRRRLVKKVLSTVLSMRTGGSDTDTDADTDRYEKFWSAFGAVLKEGLVTDTDNREQLLEICSFSSTNDPERRTSLREYVERMREGQEHVYYLTGASRTVVESSPHLEAFRDRGFEVLILTDSVDELWAERGVEFDGKRFQSVAKGQIDLDQDEDGKAERERRQQDFAPLLGWLTTALAEEVKEVRLSSRLTSSPACVVGDTFDMSPMLEKMYRASGQEVPKVKRILELNPGHPLIAGLRTAYDEREDKAGLAEVAELVYGMALLAEDGDLPDPARFVSLLATRLERAL